MRSIGSPRAVSISSGSWRVRRVGAQLAAQVEAVAVGQHQVEHQRVEAGAGEARRGRPASEPAVSTSKPALAEVVAHHRREARVVVDQQQAWRHRAGSKVVAATTDRRPSRSEAMPSARRRRSARIIGADGSLAASRCHALVHCAPACSLHALADLGALLGREHPGDVEHRLASCAGSSGRAARASAGAPSRPRRRRPSAP